MKNNLIQEVAHQPKPVSIEREPGDVISIEGVKFSGDFFRTMALPDPDCLYAIRREDDAVVLTTIRTMQDAMTFFIGHRAQTKGESNGNSL